MGIQDSIKRKQRIEDIKLILIQGKQANLEIMKSKLIANLCCDWGLSRRVVVEYVNLLIQAEFVTEEKRDKEVIVTWKN